MSNTFNISRFNRLLVFDGRNYFRRFGLVLVIIIGVNVIFWITTNYFPFFSEVDRVRPISRYELITALAAVSIVMAPGIVFGDINDKRAGASQMMMPVSTVERFLSQFLYCCLLTPVLCVVGSLVLDTLLALLPIGKYEGFTWSQFIMQFHPKSLIVNSDADVFLLDLTFDLDTYYHYWAEMVALPSICLFANLLFKKNKVAKTFSVVILIWALLMAILYSLSNNGIEIFNTDSIKMDSMHELYSQFEAMSREEQMNPCLEWFSRRNKILFGTFGTIGLIGYVLSYIKLKNLKY